MTKGEKVKEFMERHKEGIVSGITLLTGLAGLTFAMKGSGAITGFAPTEPGKFKAHDIEPVEKLAVGELVDFWQECPDIKNAIVTKLTMADIGKLGESIINDCGVETITMETPINVVLDIFDAGTQG